MIDHLLQELSDSFREGCPRADMAVYSLGGELLFSVPCPLRRILPPEPHRPRSVRKGSFTASVLIPGHGTFAFGVKAGSAGEPDRIYAFLQSLVRVLLDKEAASLLLRMEEDPCSALLKSLFTISTEEDASYVELSALALGYSMNVSRAVILLNLEHAGTSQALPGEISVLPEYLRLSGLLGEQDITGWLHDDQIIFLKALPEASPVPLREMLKEPLLRIKKQVEARFPVRVRIHAGTVARELRQYAAGLTAAQRTLEFAEIFQHGDEVHFFEDYRLETEVSQMPRRELEHFFEPHLQALRETHWLLPTMEALIRCQMRLEETARALFIHRNTLSFRLKQMRRLLRLDPVNSDSDYFTMLILCIYIRLYRIPVKAEP